MLSMTCSALLYMSLLQKVSTKAERANLEQCIPDIAFLISELLRALQRSSSRAVGAIKHTSIDD